MIVDETDIEFCEPKKDAKDMKDQKIKKAKIKFKSNQNKAPNIFGDNFDFMHMGIGGLDIELANIFRRAFASRRFPPAVLQKYGI